MIIQNIVAQPPAGQVTAIIFYGIPIAIDGIVKSF